MTPEIFLAMGENERQDFLRFRVGGNYDWLAEIGRYLLDEALPHPNIEMASIQFVEYFDWVLMGKPTEEIRRMFLSIGRNNEQLVGLGLVLQSPLLFGHPQREAVCALFSAHLASLAS